MQKSNSISNVEIVAIHKTRSIRFGVSSVVWSILLILPFLMVLLLSNTSRAEAGAQVETSGDIDIQSINISLVSEQQYKANATIDFHLSKTLVKALTHGVPLKTHIDFNLGKHRSWWWNSKNRVSRITYILKYHSLSKHYVLERINSDRRWNFSSLPLALKQMGIIQNHMLPKLPASIKKGNHYLYVTAKVTSESRSLPFKIQSYLTNSKYQIKSEGVLWALP